jgi:glutamate-5-semialdehyde dehydrogenase
MQKSLTALDKIKVAKTNLLNLSSQTKKTILLEVADKLLQNKEEILKANKKDSIIAEKDQLSSSLIERQTLTQAKIEGMAGGLKKLADLEDPLAEGIEWTHPKGMKIRKISVPIGIILIIYEARPNVTTDAFGICLKTGNAGVFKGSRQTFNTNSYLSDLILKVLSKYDLQDCYAFFNNASREESDELISSESIDLIIPRGGEALKEHVKKLAKAPILGAGGGVCHAFVAESADLDKAAKIIFNGKTQRPSVCNALETVLIHQSHLDNNSLQQILTPLKEAGVRIKADEDIRRIDTDLEPTNEEDWSTEYLELIISLKTVGSLDEAVEHINKYGTGHSDCIITENSLEGESFCNLVDSACTYVNASTRFTDGEEFGFGAEIGISTQKFHARGPIGPKDLTTYKYIILGEGQTR